MGKSTASLAVDNAKVFYQEKLTFVSSETYDYLNRQSSIVHLLVEPICMDSTHSPPKMDD